MTAGTPSALPARSLSSLTEGAGVRWLYALHRVLSRISGGRAGVYPYLICAQPVSTPGAARLRASPGTEVRRAGPDDPLLSRSPRPAQELQRRLATGAECWVLSLNQDFGGHLWLSREAFDEDEVRCRYVLPGPDCVWDFDVYVPPALRHGRAMARLWQGVSDALASQGVVWSYSRISRFNAASARSHERLGARHVATVTFLVVGPLQLGFGGPLGIRMSLGRHSRPEVQLSVAMQPSEA